MSGDGIAIVGGGPAGSLAAILLARRGLAPVVYERAAAFDGAAAAAGRSINLALAARGIRALEAAGAFAAVEPLLIPMRGRMLHEPGAPPRLMPYGQHAAEQIYSVSRSALNARLYRLAAETHGIEYRFGHELVGIDASTGRARFAAGGNSLAVDAGLLLAADGAGSAARRSLAAQGAIEAREDLLDHGYKELTIPPAADGGFALEPNALHIWPRGGFMLIALPNKDASFTATLFLPRSGRPGFAGLDAGNIAEFLAAEFPDAAPLLDDPAGHWAARPVGLLGTVTARPWSAAGRVLLIGDAAHAIVPFHGQGMNAAFEDCIALDALIGDCGFDPARVASGLEQARRDDVRAIAEMALENYDEMRAAVRDPKFQLRRTLELELERRFPERFIPRYSMVMFHPEIGYAEAQRRGRIQHEFLLELTQHADRLDDIDFSRAAALIRDRLPPLRPRSAP